MSHEPAVTHIELPGVTLFRRGKVRDVFDLGEQLLLVASDRLSAFDVVFAEGIPGKGRVLTELSRFWFEKLRDLVPNHMITTDVDQFPEPLRRHRAQLQGRSMLCHKTQALPVECVARGYLTGGGLKEYQERGSVSGQALPAGLEQASRLPRPIFTPSTKAEVGHDENIPREEVAVRLGAERAAELERLTLALYHAAARHALERGVIIADTKFEFGVGRDGRLMLIDEALTPDSSRFWPARDYRKGSSPPSYDKQFVRDYLEQIGWSKEPPAPPLPASIVEGTARRYQEILEILTKP